MKLLIENWRKFVNEVDNFESLETKEQEQEENTENLLSDEEYRKNVEEMFKKNPELAEKIIKITSDSTDDQNLSEESYFHEDGKVYELTSSFEDLLVAIGSVSGATAASMILGLDYLGAPHGDANTIISALGITGATVLLNFLSTKARESLEKRGTKLPKFFKTQKRFVRDERDSEKSKKLKEKKLTNPESKQKEK